MGTRYNLRFRLTSTNPFFTSTTGYIRLSGNLIGTTFNGDILTTGDVDSIGLFSSSGVNSLQTDILYKDGDLGPVTTQIQITNFPTTSSLGYTNLPPNAVVTLTSTYTDPIDNSVYNLFTTAGLMRTSGITGTINAWQFYKRVSNGNNEIWYQIEGEAYTQATNVTFAFTSVAGPSPRSPACFIEGTKLLAHVKDKDTYVNIEDLRSGDLVKTHLHGYKPIKFIGKGFMTNNPTQWNGCVKKLPKSGDVTDDLFVTGAHSILVDELSEKESGGMLAIYGTTDRKIDNKTLLLSWVSEKFEAVDDNKDYTYYHLVLEHDNDENKRYGIWANGVLTESQCEKHFLGKDYELL